MKLDFSLPGDGERHEYCINCHAESLDQVDEDSETPFHCGTCGPRERRIVIDPKASWWIGDDREYWHESAGVFVREPTGRFLFIQRAVFPIDALTVPAGHVDAGESAEQGALRELLEETGLKGLPLRNFATDDIVGDSCRRGSDAHRWHAYRTDLEEPAEIVLSGEGKKAMWLTLAEARTAELTYPVRCIVDRYADVLE